MGSTAIDQTGVYPGSFEQYQDAYPIKALNMSFQLSELRTSYGGCAPNIAYGLLQLGVNAFPLSSAGRNFRDGYQQFLEAQGMNTKFIHIDESVEHCSTCMMLNDLEGNQVIGFYPGPDASKRLLPSQLPLIEDVALAILGPETPTLTLRQARDLASLDIPIVFDPGQAVTDFSGDQLHDLLTISDYLIVNDYEHQVIQKNSNLLPEEIISLVGEVVITHGEKGAGVFTGDAVHHVQAAKDVNIVEVTGCGDAFRAGYCYGILEGLEQTERAQLGCLMARANLESPATQEYRISLDELHSMQKLVYGT